VPAVALGVVVLIVWAATGASYFWPGWVWFGLVLPFALVGALRWSTGQQQGRRLAMHGALSLLVELICIAVWLLSGHGGGYPWPVWPLLGLVVALGIHVMVAPPSAGAARELARRVGTLTESRKTVIEIQEAELRRVERDLHDGAQARLVSLGMSLGLADEALEEDPEAARRYLAEARTSAGLALADLRDLVRGIRPPVLADLGLAGAIEALAMTVPIPVEVSVSLPGTPPEAVESAVYFAIAEAVANVIKHSSAGRSWVSCTYGDGRLVGIVGDDGVGGADPANGSGLKGIERRLAAFDATLGVSSPPGGPTVVTLEVPCELSSPRT
jgi:signal transduction histidine kinase